MADQLVNAVSLPSNSMLETRQEPILPPHQRPSRARGCVCTGRPLGVIAAATNVHQGRSLRAVTARPKSIGSSEVPRSHSWNASLLTIRRPSLGATRRLAATQREIAHGPRPV
jgi:hypothetical protein